MFEVHITEPDRIVLDRPSTTGTARCPMLTVGFAAMDNNHREAGSVGLTAIPSIVAEVAMGWLRAALGAGWQPSDPEDAAALGRALVEAAHAVMAEARR